MEATHFSTRDAARILQVTEARVRSWARLGGLVPEPGPSGLPEFTFQQLLLLRTTRGLIEAGIPARRVRRVWSSLRRQLAADLPLTSVRILADGERAIAWDENASWQPDSGQFLLDFEAGEIAARAGADIAALETAAARTVEARAAEARAAEARTAETRPAGTRTTEARTSRSAGPPKRTAVAASSARSDAPAPRPTPPPRAKAPAPRTATQAPARSAEQWFDLASELEDTSPLEARQAYIQALALNPDFADAHLNLGRLAHEAGELSTAETHYTSATRCAPEDPIGHFNLAVLLEDLGRPDEALHAYLRALDRDPEAADAHYNLGLLLESRGLRPEAIRHLMTARRLYESSRGSG